MNPINMATRITLINMYPPLHLSSLIPSSWLSYFFTHLSLSPHPPPTKLILLPYTYYGCTRCFIIGLAVTLTFIDLIINVLLLYFIDPYQRNDQSDIEA